MQNLIILLKTSCLIVLTLNLTACSKLLFFPYKQHFLTPESLGLAYQDVIITTEDNINIHGWLLPAQGKMKGSIYFLHGNAENISTHIESVWWLPAKGYQVFMIDYRGFGKSEGVPDLPDVFLDINAGFQWLLQHSKNKPVFLLGQSLGASLGIYFVATNPDAQQYLSAVISDSAFTDYYEIVRHATASAWPTWPLQHLTAWFMDYPYNPIEVIDQISPIPLLLIHGENDTIIPVDHCSLLFAKAGQPTKMLKTAGGHIQSFSDPENRLFILDFLNHNRRLDTAKPNQDQ